MPKCFIYYAIGNMKVYFFFNLVRIFLIIQNRHIYQKYLILLDLLKAINQGGKK